MSTLEEIFAASGYRLRDYQIYIVVLGENNQVIHIRNTVVKQELEIPVEVDARLWSEKVLAKELVEAMNAAGKKAQQ